MCCHTRVDLEEKLSPSRSLLLDTNIVLYDGGFALCPPIKSFGSGDSM